MSHVLIRLAIAVATALGALAARADVVESRPIVETLAVDPGRAPRIVVKNVIGGIRVTGQDRDVVELTATETIRADTQADLERAREEATLRIEPNEQGVTFRVGSTANDCGCDCFCRWDDYVVEYEMELRVPRSAVIDLGTVNGGDIVVDGVRGDFDLHNVNGSVVLHGSEGSGELRTVNGRIEAQFERMPTGPTSFATINGPVEVVFPSDASADLRFETMNGDIWTDFDVAPLPASPIREQSRDRNRFSIRSGGSRVRIGAGGPLHSFETLNGSIYVRRAP